jgi:quaternary ammonium compound-resistance protein SugE
MWAKIERLIAKEICESMLLRDDLKYALIFLGTTPYHTPGEQTMPWVILFIAGLLEMVWALLLKQSESFTRPGPTVGFLVALFLSMFLLSQALKSLPVGTAYAVWTGIGAAGTAIVGMLFLGESRDVLKLLSLVMLVAGIIGLRLNSPH